MRRREGLAVPFHLVGAEQFRAERPLQDGWLVRQAAGAQTGPELSQMPKNRSATRHQLRCPSFMLRSTPCCGRFVSYDWRCGRACLARVLVRDLAVARSLPPDESI